MAMSLDSARDESSDRDAASPGVIGARILVVEDEEAIADFIERGLRAEGYVVESAYDGLDGERLALSGDFDLVLLDLMLPGRDGLEVIKSIRANRGTLPVIMLTARGEIADRVTGLDAGANDYLAKPFAFEELSARVRAHLRVPPQAESTILRAADIELDLVSRKVRRAGREITLTATEFDLLTYFVRHPNQVLSRDLLLSEVWKMSFHPGTNLVDVYVGYVRRKLSRCGEPVPIQTLRAAGYRLIEND